MWFKLLTLVHLCAAFPLKCPEPAQWALRANGHCVDPSKYFCLRNDLINGYSENCTRSDFQQPGRKAVLRGGIDADICSIERYQPFPIRFYTNVSTYCIFLKTLCNGEGQVVHANGNRNTDTSCRCDYRQGYTFVVKPRNQCFCKPPQEDCSCYLKTCTNSSFILSPDYQCIYKAAVTKVTQCQSIANEHEKSNKIPVIRESIHKEDYIPSLVLWRNRSGIVGCTVMFLVLLFIGSLWNYFFFRAVEIQGPGPELHVIEGNLLKFKYKFAKKESEVKFCRNDIDTCLFQKENIKETVFRIEKATKNDEGGYFVQVDKIKSEITQVKVQSIFTSELEFANFPCCIEHVEGEKLQLKCSVYSKDIRVKWYKKRLNITVKLKSDKNISIRSDKRHRFLTIKNAKVSDTGQYSILAGNVQKELEVNIKGQNSEASNFNQQGSVARNIKKKSTATVKGQNSEASDFNEERSVARNIKKKSTATVKGQNSEASNFNELGNVAGNIKKKSTATVKAVQIHGPGPELHVIEGNLLKFKYKLAKKVPLLRFYRNETCLSEKENIKETDFRIEKATKDDEGGYFVQVDKIKSEITQVKVQSMFTSELNQTNWIEGEKLQLKFSVCSENVCVVWSKKSHNITEKLKSDENISIDSKDKDHFMTIAYAKLSDSGQYSIVAGNVQKELEVNVTEDNTAVKCHYCEKMPVYRCYECSNVLCDDCYLKHNKLTNTKHHTLQSTNDKLLLNNTFEVSGEILDMKSLPGGLLVFVVFLSDKLLTYSVSDNQQNEISVGKHPCRIAILDRNTVVVLLSPGLLGTVDSIGIVDIRQRQVIQHVDCTLDLPPYPFCPMFYTDDQLYISNRSGITVMDMSGTTDREIELGFEPRDMCYDTKAARIYFIGHSENKLICIDRDGNTLFTFTDTSLTNVKCLTIDNEGYVLILCHEDYNFKNFKVHRISPDGKSSEVIITGKHNTSHRFRLGFSSICFQEESDEVIIGVEETVYTFKTK